MGSMLSPVCLVGNRVRAANKGPHQRGTCMFSRLELEGWEKSDSGESLLRDLCRGIINNMKLFRVKYHF